MNHPRSYRITMALLAAVLATVPAAAVSPKQPWELTPEEHAATRVAHNSEAPGNATAGFSDKAPVVVFDGKKNPAAFMPHELYGRLVDMAFNHPPKMQQAFRDDMRAALVAQGFGADFFQRLEPIAKPMLAATAAAMNAHAAGDEASKDTEDLVQCRARAASQQAAYNLFGKERFLRFLYQGLAPNFSMTTDATPTKRLLYLEGGCQ